MTDEIKSYLSIREPGIYESYQELVGLHDCQYAAYSGPWLLFLEKLLDQDIRLLNVEEAGRPLGCIAFCTRESAGLRIADSLPYTQASFGGPIVRPGLSPAREREIAAALIKEFYALGAAENWAACTIKMPPPTGHFQAEIEADYRLEREILLTDLCCRPPLPSSIQWDVNKALKHGIRAEIEQNEAALWEFYAIYKEEMTGRGAWVREKRFFELLATELMPAEKALLIAARGATGEALGGILLGLGNGIADYTIQAASATGRAWQANSLLIARSMEILAAKGFRLWNWYASPNDGVQRFKKKWSTSAGTMRVHWKALDREKVDMLKSRGREWLAAHFPWYYVLPFELMGN